MSNRQHILCIAVTVCTGCLLGTKIWLKSWPRQGVSIPHVGCLYWRRKGFQMAFNLSDYIYGIYSQMRINLPKRATDSPPLTTAIEGNFSEASPQSFRGGQTWRFVQCFVLFLAELLKKL